MLIVMNRFKVKPDRSDQFEKVWRDRDSHLAGVPGFKSFSLLRGPEGEDHVLYASHTVWESEAAFEAWTRSEAFRKAHAQAGEVKGIYLDHPYLEVFEAIL